MHDDEHKEIEVTTQMTVAEYRKAFGDRSVKVRAGNGKRNECEIDEQIELFEWARDQYEADPVKWFNLDLMHCSLNGVKLFKGQAVKAKKAGMRKGILDVSLPVPCGRYHGLYIEMKWGSNKPTKDQADVIQRLEQMGYSVAVCWSFKEARQVVIDYYKLRLKSAIIDKSEI